LTKLRENFGRKKEKMEIQDPHIQSILHMIENRHAIATPDHEIINEIQLAFEFHLINFYEYESLLVKLLSKHPIP
jgi:hypothetical protein